MTGGNEAGKRDSRHMSSQLAIRGDAGGESSLLRKL
jgi:hypothetical protein